MLTFTLASQGASKTPLEYLDLHIGTKREGNTFPGVCRPFGLVKFTPQTRAGEVKGDIPYHYDDARLQGIRNTNFISGSAVPDYGSFTIMALVGPLRVNPSERASRFSHEEEVATPYYYAVSLQDYDVKLEVVSTVRAGHFRFTFPESQEAYILVQPNNTPKAEHTKAGNASVAVDPDSLEIIGSNPAFRYYIATGQSAGFSGHFAAVVNKKPAGFGTWNATGVEPNARRNSGQPGAFFRFATRAGETIELRVGASFTSIEQARRNRDTEVPGWDFAGIRRKSRDLWNQALSRITVKGGTDDDRTSFYTSLYHALLLPKVFSDVDGSYPGFADDQEIHKASGFVYHDDFSVWDTYRALHPLLLLVEPSRTYDFINSMLVKAEQGGWLPIFPAWNNYTTEMIGDHVISVIVDAYRKGFTRFDTEKAYRYVRKNATEMAPASEYQDGKGRRAVDIYQKLGYVPLEEEVLSAFHTRAQVSRTLEYAYDDYCLAQFARELGKPDDYRAFIRRASNYKNIFDPSTGFVRGRYTDGSWVAPFNPAEKAPYITEATPWVYTWYVPHDVQGLIQLMGGREVFVRKLDELFERELYRHGNEPSHQIAYLYNYAGAPWKTQDRVRRILASEYNPGPAGLAGNDDAGQMSAWYVLSAMGFYTVCPGNPVYEIGSPLFTESRIRLEPSHYQGKEFVIEARNASPKNRYVQSVTLNGQPWTKSWFPHSAITQGGRLVLEMGPKPNRAWGSRPEDAPPSLTLAE